MLELTHRAIAAVVFDYGGVLTTPVRDSISAWLKRDGIDPGSFSRTLKAWLSRSAPSGSPIHRLETGDLEVEEFNRLFAAELASLDGSPVQPQGLLDRLFAEMHVDQAMLGLVADLRRAGITTAVLSNSWGNTYPRVVTDGLFDPVVISGRVGLRKPDARIFELVLARLRLPAERVVFVDDAAPNIEGAHRCGLHTILHTGPDSTRRQLCELIPQLPHEDKE